MEANPDIVNVHLRRIKSERADGDIAVAKLIKSIQQLEDDVKIKLFTGKTGLKQEGLTEFTAEEEYKFLI